MSHCAVLGCKTSIFNKSPGVSLHSCPRSSEMRSKWLMLLRNRCPMLDWTTSKICSKHFDNKHFDSERKLKDNALPTLFPISTQPQVKAAKTMDQSAAKTKMDRLLNKFSQSQLIADIRKTTSKLKEPLNLNEFVTPDLQSQSDAPMEAKLWLLIKKQANLNNRLMELVVKNKKNAETANKSLEEMKASKKELEKSVDTFKYIVKCLQEKQATLEEQIEILSAVESR